MAAPDFWNNQEKAQEVVAELKALKAVLKPLEEVIKAADDLAALVEMAQEDEGLAAEVPGELQAAGKDARSAGNQGPAWTARSTPTPPC